jgi:hypothetical protein
VPVLDLKKLRKVLDDLEFDSEICPSCRGRLQKGLDGRADAMGHRPGCALEAVRKDVVQAVEGDCVVVNIDTIEEDHSISIAETLSEHAFGIVVEAGQRLDEALDEIERRNACACGQSILTQTVLFPNDRPPGRRFGDLLQKCRDCRRWRLARELSGDRCSDCA